MAKKVIGWILMALTIVTLSVLVGVNGKYIFTKDKYYSQKELDARVEEAYENGVNSNTDLLETILFYKNEAEKNKATADSFKSELDKEKENSLAISSELKTALADKKTAEDKIVALNKQISDNNLTIQQNEDEIARLETRIASLEEAGATNNAEIVSLNATINSLRKTNTSLQETNSSNLETISSLNATINSLNTQISNLNKSQSENLNKIADLNVKISQLQTSISYYENYIKTLENSDKVVLTFEYDNSVINIQVVNKGSTISISTPADTEKIVFNGWKNEAGESVDFATYTATKSEKFTADLTYKHKVTFYGLNDSIIDTQYVVDGDHAVVPSIYEGKCNVSINDVTYRFYGYSVDRNNVVDLNELIINNDINLYGLFSRIVYYDLVKTDGSSISRFGLPADYDGVYETLFTDVKARVGFNDHLKFNCFKFFDGSLLEEDYVFSGDNYNLKVICYLTNFYDVTFEIDGVVDTSRSQIIEENTFASTSAVASTDRHVFDGWYVDDVKVDISTYAITKTTKFVAKFIDKVQAKFIVDGEQYGDLQYVVVNGKVVKPENPTKEGYTFNGWTVNGVDLVDILSYTINEDTIFNAKFTVCVTWKSLDNSSLNFDKSHNGTFTFSVSGLIKNDTFRVNIQRLSAQDDYDSGCSSWDYMDTGRIDHTGNVASLTVNCNELMTISVWSTSDAVVNLLFSCSSDGILTIKTSSNYNSYIYINHFIVSSIEVLR